MSNLLFFSAFVILFLTRGRKHCFDHTQPRMGNLGGFIQPWFPRRVKQVDTTLLSTEPRGCVCARPPCTACCDDDDGDALPAVVRGPFVTKMRLSMMTTMTMTMMIVTFVAIVCQHAKLFTRTAKETRRLRCLLPNHKRTLGAAIKGTIVA